MNAGPLLTSRQRSLAFFTLLIALVLEIVDLTIVNTVLPAIGQDLRASAVQQQWFVAAYGLSFAVLLMLGGRLGDLFGGRRMFLIGVGGFTLASLLCGVAQTPQHLLGARILQGVTGAMMGPQVMTMIQLLYSPVERIGRMAWFGVVGGLSAIAGPLLGGILIAMNAFGLGWRLVFLLNIPIGMVALIAGFLLLPKAEPHPDTRIDFAGVTLFGSGLFCFLFPIIQDGQHKIGLALAGFWLLAVLLLLVGWIGLKRRQAQRRAILFQPEVFRNPSFALGIAISLAFSASNTGFLFVFAYALQRDFGYSALQTGMLHIPFSAGVMFGMAFLGRRYLALYGRIVLMAGCLAMACGVALVMLWMARGAHIVPMVLPALTLAGVGMGLVSGPIGSVTVARVQREEAGSASGMLKTVQQMGGALGVAMSGTGYFAWGAGAGGLAAAGLVVLALLCASFILAGRLPVEIFPASPVRPA